MPELFNCLPLFRCQFRMGWLTRLREWNPGIATCRHSTYYIFHRNRSLSQSCPRVRWTRGSGRVGSGHDFAGFWRVGSGQHFGFSSFFTDYFLVPKSMWIFEFYIRIDWFSTIFDIIINKLINIIIQLKTIHIGEGSGRGSGRVGSDFLSVIAGLVGSTFRRVGSGRVQEKWPVDNSGLSVILFSSLFN